MNQEDAMQNVVVAITGASGVVYGIRLLEVLLAAGRTIYFSVSPTGRGILRQELGINLDGEKDVPSLIDPEKFLQDEKLERISQLAGLGSDELVGWSSRFHFVKWNDFQAPIASGTFPTSAMVICPCSGGTLAAVANGISANLIHRAAEVHLKEGRKLILVIRETPLSLVYLRNLCRVAEAGATVLPAAPAFYHGARSVSDLVDFVVAKICDQLGINHTLVPPWPTGKDKA